LVVLVTGARVVEGVD